MHHHTIRKATQMCGVYRLLTGSATPCVFCDDGAGGCPRRTERGKTPSLFQQILAGTAGQSGVSKQGDLYDAIVYTTNPDAVRAAGIHVNSSFPSFVTAQVSTRDLEKLVAVSDVTFIDPGSVNHVQNDVSVPETGASLVQGGSSTALRTKVREPSCSSMTPGLIGSTKISGYSVTQQKPGSVYLGPDTDGELRRDCAFRVQLRRGVHESPDRRRD